MISGIGGRETSEDKREWQEAIRLKRVDMVWIRKSRRIFLVA